MIQALNTSLVYGDHGKQVFACRAVSIDVRPNEFLGILGPSGSGKSSLLYLLSGLKLPTEGEVRYENESLSGMHEEKRSQLRLRDFGFVFQQSYLLGYLSVLENVLVGAPHLEAREQALDLLDRLGMTSKITRFPHELSGGERQRACVARALLGDPKVVFADEPTAALDHENGSAVVELLNRHRGNGSLVMVTHDPSMLNEADRIVRLVDGQIVK